MNQTIIVPLISFFAGFIDAIAGGGGLITIPMWVILLGPGAHVVGTNKIGAFASSSMALFVYQRRHKLPWQEGIWFLVAIGIGSFLGSQLTKFLSAKYFSLCLLLLCPLILLLVWKKESLFSQRPNEKVSKSQFVFTGLAVGIYDGFFGPGGGTFMLLSLLWFTQLPLMSALALSKLANAISSGISLSGFAIQGVVNWRWGFISGFSILIGAFLGARLASKDTVKVVKPALTLVVILLMVKIILDFFNLI
ncbi:MAG: sulfite exporter TauE/SafE family protein [Bacteriovoracaceae bacterium]|nr:sulfite exporter TauE/SafE family protein [Bacteriovoracaceae bacterium]